MTENHPPPIKIEDLKKGKFSIIAKVTFADTGNPDDKFLQRGRLSDETGSIDFVIYKNAHLEPLETDAVYELTNVFASDNTGFLTVRPNKRMDNCTITKLEIDIETNPSMIFRDQNSIPSILRDELCETASIVSNRILLEKFSSGIPISDRPSILAALHNDLIEQYKNRDPIPYGDNDYQTAYMFGFFPFYIGMIYHILRTTNFDNLSEVFRNDMKICLYGCGPAPELLGFVGYLRDFHPDIHRINVTFLDQHDWNDWREFSLSELATLYWNGKIQPSIKKIDLLRFSEEKDEKVIEAVSSASIHNIQNVISDLYHSPENLQKLGPSFSNLYEKTASGSVMILSDQYYGKTARIFSRISSDVKKSGLGRTLTEPESVQNYQRDFDTPQQMKAIGHHYKKNMAFYGMVLKKT